MVVWPIAKCYILENLVSWAHCIYKKSDTIKMTSIHFNNYIFDDKELHCVILK